MTAPRDRATLLETLGLSLWAVGALATEGLVFAGLALAAIGWILRHGRDGLRTHRRGLVAVGIFVALLFVSKLWSPRYGRMDTPWSALHFLLFPVAVLAWRDLLPDARRTVWKTLAGTSLVAALVAIQQHFWLFPYPAWLQKLAPVHRVSEEAPGGYMAGGLHFHRLKHAHTLLPLSFAMADAWWRRRSKTLQDKALALVFAGLLLVSVAFTFAKAAIGAFLVACLVGALATRLPARARAFVAVGLLVASPLAATVLELVHRGPEDRLVAWDFALQVIRGHPLFGCGYGGYARTVEALMGGHTHPVFIYIHVDAHNTLLTILAENGLSGLALLAFAIACYGRLLGRLSAAQLAIVAFAAVAGVTHNLLYHPVVTGALALALALAEPPPEQPPAV